MLLINRFNFGLRAIIGIVLVLMSAGLFNYCAKDQAHMRSYPQVKTNPVTNITNKGAFFNGNILTLGTEPIIEHGFVWSEQVDPNLLDDKIFLGSTTEGGVFTADISTALAKDIKYYVKAFVKTNEHVVYGMPVEFVSLGSGAPIITGFEPDSAAWLDTIKISGKKFSRKLSQNKVLVNQTECSLVSSTDTTIFFTLSENACQLKSAVSVEVAGNITTFNDDSLKLITPKFSRFNPVTAYWGDTLIIRGSHFRSYSLRSDNYIKLGGINTYRVGKATDSIIKVLVPNNLTAVTNSLAMSINGFAFQADNLFELKPPFFTFSPLTGTWGNLITMTGRVNAIAALNKISFFGTSRSDEILQQYIISTSQTSITFKVPPYLSSAKSNIVYESGPFRVISTDTFRLHPPEIKSFSPISGPSATCITIKGKYFSSQNSKVSIGSSMATISSVNDSVIVATVPPMKSGSYKVTVQAERQNSVSADYFNVTNPLITMVSPLTATYNEQITVEGQDLTNPSFVTTAFFNSFSAKIVSSTSSRVVITVRDDLDTLPKYISVQVGNGLSTYSEPFTYAKPQITSISPAIFSLGNTLTITGYGFHPDASKNAVYWNSYLLPIVSVSPTSLVVSVPVSLPSGSSKLLILSGGYRVYSSSSFDVVSPWETIPITGVDWNSTSAEYSKNVAFSVSGKGYLMSNMVPKIYRFDPVSNSFTYLNYFDNFYNVAGLTSVVNNDTAYIISGTKGMFRFDVPSSMWIKIGEAPSSFINGIAFSLNGKIYYGLTEGEMSKFWEYNPKFTHPWSLRNSFPESGEMSPVSFTINNTGYALFFDRTFYSYDPVNDRWTKRASYPGSGNRVTGRIAFSVNSLGYVGGGRDLDLETSYTDIWSYNPSTDSWTEQIPFPGERRFNSISFTIGNKSYVGFGWTYLNGINQASLYDFLEFNPAIISK